jgi:hypothetical protein
MLLVSRMANFLEHEQSSMINLSMSRFIHDMISLLYSDNCSEITTRRTMEWSLSSQELPSLAYNLVRLHDCFVHTLNGPKVLFDVTQPYTRGILTAFVKIRWQAPRVTFSELSSHLLEGDPYRITPRFASIELRTDDNSGFRWLKDETTYTVTKSSLPLLWDDAEQCFYVPDHQEVCQLLPCLTIALLTVRLGNQGWSARNYSVRQDNYTFPRRRAIRNSVSLQHQTSGVWRQARRC